MMENSFLWALSDQVRLSCQEGFELTVLRLVVKTNTAARGSLFHAPVSRLNSAKLVNIIASCSRSNLLYLLLSPEFIIHSLGSILGSEKMDSKPDSTFLFRLPAAK